MRNTIRTLSFSAIVALLFFVQTATYSTLVATDDSDNSSSDVSLSLQSGGIASGIIGATHVLHLTDAARSPYVLEWSTALADAITTQTLNQRSLHIQVRGPPRA